MGKKKLLMWVMAVLLVFMTTNCFAQEEKKGPKIVIEEEEITVLDGDKEIEKIYVGKYGKQQSMIKEELWNKGKQLKIKDIPNPKLKFLDTNGKLVKEIDLSPKEWQGTIKEMRPYFKQGEFKTKFITVKRPSASKNGKYVVVDNSTFAQAGYPIDTGKIILYGTTGKELFVKQFPQGRSFGENLLISDNGTVAVLTGEDDEGPHDRILYVFDDKGKELLAYPKERERESDDQGPQIEVLDILRISLNGHYLAARVSFVKGGTVTVFFDLEKNIFFKADRSYVVYEISDSGIVKADYYDNILKKRSSTVYIDIEKGGKP